MDTEPIAFDDYAKRRNLIFDKAAHAIQNKLAFSNDRYSLSVEDVGVKDRDTPYSLKEQKEAILTGKTLTRALTGRLVLKDLEGNVIDKGSKRTLMNVPYLTDRGTFIRSGNESVIINQFRLRPGVYHRKTVDKQFESMFTVVPGTGQQFKLRFDPSSAQFHMVAGNRKMAAYPIFKSLGISDEALESAWGKEVLEKNKPLDNARAVHTANEVFLKNKVAPVEQEQPEIPTEEIKYEQQIDKEQTITY